MYKEAMEKREKERLSERSEFISPTGYGPIHPAETNPTHIHLDPLRHIPPHERKNLFHIDLYEGGNCINTVFQDMDEADAVEQFARVIAPPEIRILINQGLEAVELLNKVININMEKKANLLQENECDADTDLGKNIFGFSCPFLGEDVKKLYRRLYADNAEKYIACLDTSPNEIAIVSRLLTYMIDRLKMMEEV